MSETTCSRPAPTAAAAALTPSSAAPGRDNLYVACGRPTVLFRDGKRDKGSCRKNVRPARLVLDRKDRLKGPCDPGR